MKVKYILLFLSIIICGYSATYLRKWHIIKYIDQGKGYWEDVRKNEIPAWMKQALESPSREIIAADAIWEESQLGLETSSIKIYDRESLLELEELFLARVDSKLYEVTTHVSPESGRDIDEWADYLNSTLVINGSYYDKLGEPETPVVSNSKRFGPKKYEANHGALLVTSSDVTVVEFGDQISLASALSEAKELMVSYPLLVDSNKKVRAQGHETWLANRSFIGHDYEGRIIFGVTKNGYFSLRRFAEFLKSSKLKIKVALNLDGGPVSSMAIRTNNNYWSTYGRWEIAGDKGVEKILKTPIANKKFPLPIVIAVKAKSNKS